MMGLVGLIERLNGLIDGYAAASSAIAYTTEVGLASPWADNSHLADITLAGLFGDVSMVRLDRDRAMRLPVIRKSRRLIAAQIARLPLRAHNSDGSPWTQQPTVLKQPEAGTPRSTTLTWLVDQLIFYPFAHLIVTERLADGYPRRVQLVQRHLATYGTDGVTVTAYDGRPVSSANLIRVDGPDAGLLIDGRDTLRRAIVLNQAVSSAEDNPVPVINLRNTSSEALTPTEVDTLLSNWQAKRRTSGVSYTPNGIEIEQFGAKAEALLIDGQRRLDIELARQMGMPAWAVDAPVEGSSLTYSNRAMRNWELLDLALSPYMTAVEDRLSLGDVTPEGSYVKFVTDELTLDDRKTRYETYKLGLDGGWLTVEDVRALEQLNTGKVNQ